MKADSFLSQLDQLFRHKRFFELLDETAKYNGENQPELLFYRGAVANKIQISDEWNCRLSRNASLPTDFYFSR